MSVSPSNLTPGMVKKQVIVDKTDQAAIMEFFGPPDLITKKGDYEMWGYDKISREAAYTAFGWEWGVEVLLAQLVVNEVAEKGTVSAAGLAPPGNIIFPILQ